MEQIEGTTACKKIPEIRISFHPKIKPGLLPQLNGSRATYQLLMENWDLGTIEVREEARVLYLNSANRVLGCHLLSIGGISSTVLDLRIMYAIALKCGAVSLIITHNHPSGSARPNAADRMMTD